jgi:hypothetical protein
MGKTEDRDDPLGVVIDAPERTCACVSHDRFECWRRRYNLPLETDVRPDGGPCECACHDDWEEEDNEY